MITLLTAAEASESVRAFLAAAVVAPERYSSCARITACW